MKRASIYLVLFALIAMFISILTFNSIAYMLFGAFLIFLAAPFFAIAFANQYPVISNILAVILWILACYMAYKMRIILNSDSPAVGLAGPLLLVNFALFINAFCWFFGTFRKSLTHHSSGTPNGAP